MKRYYILTLLVELQILFITSCTLSKKNYTHEPKLLISATLNGRNEFYGCADTSWFAKPCLELKIDTIDLINVLYMKDRDIFIYDNHTYFTQQLYDINQISYLKNFIFKNVYMNYYHHYFPLKLDANCISEDILDKIRFLISTNCNRKESNKYLIRFYTHIYNSTDQKELEIVIELWLYSPNSSPSSK